MITPMYDETSAAETIEQNENLDRVKSRIGKAIIEFVSTHSQFRADELREYVSTCTNGALAPGSADRILRDLRQCGLVNYRVLNRRHSLYEVVPSQN